MRRKGASVRSCLYTLLAGKGSWPSCRVSGDQRTKPQAPPIASLKSWPLAPPENPIALPTNPASGIVAFPTTFLSPTRRAPGCVGAAWRFVQSGRGKLFAVVGLKEHKGKTKHSISCCASMIPVSGSVAGARSRGAARSGQAARPHGRWYPRTWRCFCRHGGESYGMPGASLTKHPPSSAAG